MRLQRDLAALQARIGHGFRDRELLDQALTHVSAAAGANIRTASYERLEFLGDRVLGLVIASELLAIYAAADEGELSRRLSDLVRKETCAAVAEEWNIGLNLRLGAGEAQTGGRRKLTILADACEAVIGAAFIDGGLEAARGVVLAGWAARIRSAPGDRRDAKTTLQEKVQGEGFPPPVYREVSRTGPDHALVFVVTVSVTGIGSASGEGRSKREAEQAAASAFLSGEYVAVESKT